MPSESAASRARKRKPADAASTANASAPAEHAVSGPPSSEQTSSVCAAPALPDATEPPTPLPHLVVGIGASAGGLEAFKSFFTHMPVDSQMAFVLVQHLAPQHNSLLVELVGRSTAMPVVEAADGLRVEPRHVYVIPPDATLTIQQGVLQLTKPAPPRQYRWPIDTFFASLAQDQGDCAVCVVLSGSGSDGARGLRAVKEHGGLALAQAQGDKDDHVAMSGMPASAAATGLVDDVLAVEAMPERLLAHQRHLRGIHDRKGPDGTRNDLAAHLLTISSLLRAEVGHDFSQYKEKTLVRRIQRRMHVLQAETVPEYIGHLRHDSGEVQKLFRELLIGVTEFFRDRQAFAALQATAIPALLAGKGAADTVRVWVPGCATGEEAYSIAIALREAMNGQRGMPKVQIFATDIDDRSINVARAGRYSMPQPGISAERQERWFTQEGSGDADHLCVIKTLREMVVFSPHSAIKDPPFSRLDLVSCRNLLIYMNPELQERLIKTFHYALKPGGLLLLGPSEGLGRNSSLFNALDKKHRLYTRRNEASAAVPMSAPNRDKGSAGSAARGAAPPPRPGAEDPIDRVARRALEKYAPAYVVIDANHDIVRFAGNTGRYLEPASGAASLNLFGLLHQGLRAAARSAVQQALSEHRTVVQEGLDITIDGHRQPLRLVVEPLPEADGQLGDGAARLCVVAFNETKRRPHSGETAAAIVAPDAGENARVQALEEELESTRIQLHTAIDQMETANEEMKSANEEYQSVNEELQSSNEELETSKEEMQSINEELQTVNAEMNSKNETLAHLNNDLQNLMESTQIATLFLNSQLHVTGFTPTITELFHLRDGDRGRPLSDISARIHYPELQKDAKQVLRNLALVERELRSESGSVFVLRMRPYRTVDNLIDGVVLTFVDITERQQHEFERARLAAIVASSNDAIISHTLDGTITSWNSGAERMFGHTAGRILGRPLSLLLPVGANGDLQRIQDTCAQDQRGGGVEMTWLRQDGTPLEVAMTCSPIHDTAGRVIARATIARDISERKLAVQHRELMLGELNHRVKNTLGSVQAIALQTLASAPSLEAFKDAFMARLMALSNTHNLLADDAWNGVDLREIVDSELAPYEKDGYNTARIVGEPLQLTSKMALALSMALHELATNAGKYGALSVSHGQVAVDWRIREVHGQPWLRLRWVESGGPTVAEPTRRGFGSRLITEGLAFELDGEVALAFDPDGVSCTIDVPLPDLPLPELGLPELKQTEPTAASVNPSTPEGAP